MHLHDDSLPENTGIAPLQYPLNAMDKGWLKINPEPLPRQPGEGVAKCPYQTSAVDLRLGSEIAYFKSGIAVNIDLRKGDFNSLFGANSETRIITDEQPFMLRPRKPVLGKTLERVECRCSMSLTPHSRRESKAKAPTPVVACLSISPHRPSMQVSPERSRLN